MNLRIRSSIAIFSLIVGMFAVVLSGCTALNTFPQAARAGDTVALAVGSADGMSRANTSASFESDAQLGTFYDLTPNIRGIFRLYADQASSLYGVGSTAGQVISTSGHEPWITIMAVDLPVGLPTGPGKVHITTSAEYPTIGSHINDLPVGLDILPGTGAVSDLAYEFGVGSSQPGDLSLLEALPHAQVIPDHPQSTGWPTYGAIEMKLHVPTTQGVALAPTALRVVADDMNILSSSSVLYSHDSNQDLTVMFLEPRGKLRHDEPRFSIIPLNNDDFTIDFSQTPVINSVSYYDIDGKPVAGPLVSEFTVDMR
jgi:hypothetical protein